MADRAPIFELHIRPMFRLIDVEHMKIRNRNLDDRDEVARDWKDIHDELTNSLPMPTDSTGGPWPQEWIDLFERWGKAGGRGLDLNVGTQYEFAERSDVYELSCNTTLPHFGAKTWLDPLSYDSGALNYRLVLETVDPAPQPLLVPVQLKDRFRKGPNSLTSVTVEDAAGRHVINFATS